MAAGMEQIIDERVHPGGFGGHPPHHAIKLSGAEPGLLPVTVSQTSDHAERPLQLVAGVNDVVAQLPRGHPGSGFGLGACAEPALELAEH